MTEVVERTAPAVARHPLEPLSEEELVSACRILKEARGLPGHVRISSATLAEPAKDEVRGFTAGDPIDRRALVVVYDRQQRLVSEAVVSVTRGQVDDWRDVPGAQPPLMIEEYLALADRVRSDPRYQEALARRGVTDLEHIQVDPWPAGWFGSELDRSGRRLVRAMSYVREGLADNGYAHPVENLVVFLDHDTGEIVEIEDTGPVPVPTEHGRYDAESARSDGAPLRRPARLDIVQPDGPGFTVEGNLLTWETWQMRVSTHPFEGLVLHEVGWRDGERVRPILYRASIADMVVPYGSTMTNHWWKNAFDAGEVGLGKLLNSLALGCDCLGEIRYLDSVIVDEEGNPATIPNAVCIHEEDFGILWKHWDFTSDTTDVRRSRRLVVSTIATVGNYDYAFYWYFYLDGTIQLEIKMTGIVQTQAVTDGAPFSQAVQIAPQLAAPHHQHLFCFRLDFDLDGAANAVSEVDVVPLPPEENPYHNGFDTQKTAFRTEQEAQRLADPGRSRTWLIENRSSLNRLGQPVAYKLMPGYTPTMLASQEAAVRQRATFGTRNLWVTPFDPAEMHAAGDYPAQHPGGDGLPRWTQADRPIEDTDVVLWHTFGSTHISRPEDWPVMPVEMVGFTLKPYGFFDRNPALDLAPQPGHCD